MTDEGNFCLYVREFDGIPRIHTISSLRSGDLPGYRYSLSVVISYDALPNGLPPYPEKQRADKLEDQAAAVLKRIGAVPLGHVVGHGHSVAIFRSKSPGPPEIEVKSGLFKKEKLMVKSREDPEWEWFLTEIAPTKREVHISQNLQLLNTLEKHGDQAHLERPIDYTFNFRSAENRAACVVELEKRGYPLNTEGMWEPEPGFYWVSVVANGTVDQDEIADRCLELSDLAAAHGGEFDGWTCPVMTG